MSFVKALKNQKTQKSSEVPGRRPEEKEGKEKC